MQCNKQKSHTKSKELIKAITTIEIIGRFSQSNTIQVEPFATVTPNPKRFSLTGVFYHADRGITGFILLKLCTHKSTE